MLLIPSASSSFLNCATKVFLPKEQHITRLCNKSVLILMKEGELRFRENGALICLTAGEYYIQRHGLLQEGVPLSAPPTYFYVEFQGTYEEKGMGLPLRGTFQEKNVSSLIDRMEKLYLGHHQDIFRLHSYLLRIFSELMSTVSLKDEKQNTAFWVRNYLDSNYHAPISLEKLAQTFGYHKDYISRIFKEQYGVSPHQHLVSQRMKHACLLLETSDLSIEQIAMSVGYSDFSVFYRSFRKIFDISPREYRLNGKNL